MNNQSDDQSSQCFKVFNMDIVQLFFTTVSILSLTTIVYVAFTALSTPMLSINSDYYCSKKVDSSERPSVLDYNECMKSEDHYYEMLSQLHDSDSSIDWFDVRSYVRKMNNPSHQGVYEYLTNVPQKNIE